MGTTLAFETPAGSAMVEAGTRHDLGEVDVSPFQRIRVFAGERPNSVSGVRILMILVEPGSRRIARLDALDVEPGSSFNRVYEVPVGPCCCSGQSPAGYRQERRRRLDMRRVNGYASHHR